MLIKRLNKNFSILDKEQLIAHKGIYGYSTIFKRYVKPNSFESCKLAIDNNIPFECDVRNTKDNICVLAHDSVIKHDEKEIKINKYKIKSFIQ